MALMAEVSIRSVSWVYWSATPLGRLLKLDVSNETSMVGFLVPCRSTLTTSLPFCSILIHTGWGGETFLPPRLLLLLCNISNRTIGNHFQSSLAKFVTPLDYSNKTTVKKGRQINTSGSTHMNKDA